MGGRRAAAAGRQARRPAALGRPAGNPGRAAVPEPHRLPAGSPAARPAPESTVYEYFAQWRDDGTFASIVDAWRERVRLAAGRDATPSAGGIDGQGVKTAGAGGERGFDGAKRITGRKRNAAADVLGLLPAVVATAASLDDAAAAPAVPARLDGGDDVRLRADDRVRLDPIAARPVDAALPVEPADGRARRTAGAVHGEVRLDGAERQADLVDRGRERLAERGS